MSSSNLPAFVTGELRKDEAIIWQGRPDPALAFQCGLPVGLIAIFIMSRLHYEWLSRFHVILDLVNMAFNVVPVVCLGTFALAPIFFYLYARQTFYLYTNQRILIVHGGMKRQFQSFALENLTPMFQMKVLASLSWPGMHPALLPVAMAWSDRIASAYLPLIMTRRKKWALIFPRRRFSR